MYRYSFLLVLLVLATYSSAFTVGPIRPTSTSVTKTTLFLDLPADPLVLAAGGIALVGAIGTAVISGKLNDLEGGEGGGNGGSSSTDVSIPYDAAAKMAYDAAGRPGDYEAFKTKYEADAVADVIAKQKK